MRNSLRFLGKVVAGLLLVAFAGMTAIGGWAAWHYTYGLDLPDHRHLAGNSAARICEPQGESIFVPLAVIPPIIRTAFLAAEDPEFYARPPVNPFIEFAGVAMFNRRPAAPAISNAVVRCLMSSHPHCCQRMDDWHIGNMILMHRVERDLPKDRIYEIYLNEVWMGRGAYGAAAAADAYFGKPLSDLTVAETAYIAAIPRAHPRMNRDMTFGTSRRNIVLDRMAEGGAISAAQAESAKQMPLRLQEFPKPI